MSPQSAEMLVREIMPRLRALIPSSVHTVGHEDHEELVQDSTLMAVRMLTSAELRGKKVTAGNIAYFTILHARSGRRSYSAECRDVMHPKGPITRGEPDSMEYPVREDDLGGEPLMLSEVFSHDHEDPSTCAARKLDWDSFKGSLNARCSAVLQVLAEGGHLKDVARTFNVSLSSIQNTRKQLAARIREFFGNAILEEIAQLPQWKHNLLTQRELMACRESRQHS